MRQSLFPPTRPAALFVLASALLAVLVSTTIAGNVPGTRTPSTEGAPELVFASDRDGNLEIYAMRSNGHQQRRLTVDPAADVDPTVSQHGLIAFASDRDGDIDLFAMSADGRVVARLTRLPGDETQPAFSPDGSKLAFAHGGDVYVMDANGRHVRNVTQNPAEDADPSWAPDGKHLAFSSDRGGSREIFVMALGSKRGVAVTRSGTNSAPDWSPDGSRIAFLHADDVRLVSARGGTESVVAASVSAPSFSPDGTEVAVADGRDVVRISLATGERVNLSFSAAIDAAPDWRAPSTGGRSR